MAKIENPPNQPLKRNVMCFGNACFRPTKSSWLRVN